MFKAPQCGAFRWYRIRLKWVDFNDITEAIQLVRFDGGVKARIKFVPAIACTGGGNTVTPLVCGQGAAIDEVAVEIFFAGQKRAPRGVAVRAIIQRA